MVYCSTAGQVQNSRSPVANELNRPARKIRQISPASVVQIRDRSRVHCYSQSACNRQMARASKLHGRHAASTASAESAPTTHADTTSAAAATSTAPSGSTAGTSAGGNAHSAAQPAAASEPDVWSFAYGANMSDKAMRKRRGIHPFESRPASLHGWRLVCPPFAENTLNRVLAARLTSAPLNVLLAIRRHST